MRAVIAAEPGGSEALTIVERPDLEPGPGELLVDVAASAVNRADVMQRRGLYPPPPGAPDTLGLELSGTVRALGSDVQRWSLGDTVCAVVAGGGYAEQALVPASTAMALPPGLDVVSAAAVPEVFATAYDNLFVRAELTAGETVLLHGGSSGVGTAAIQLAKRAGARVVVTVGTQEKAQACRELGADLAVNYRQVEDFGQAIREAQDGRGVDVILDIIGGDYLAANVRLLEVEGRMVTIGLMGGAKAELDMARLLRNRLRLMGSTLRARPVEQKADLARRLESQVWPGFADGSLRPIIHSRYPLAEVARAHDELESSTHIGKILLLMGS